MVVGGRMKTGTCEVHGGFGEVNTIQFCGESVDVCNSCLLEQTGTKTKEEFQDIEGDRYYALKDKLLLAAGKTE